MFMVLKGPVCRGCRPSAKSFICDIFSRLADLEPKPLNRSG